MFPRLERYDVEFDLLEAFLPEFPPAMFLQSRPELGDVSRLAVTVTKMRGSPISRVTRECEVVDGVGMRVLARTISPNVQPIPFAGYHGLLARSPERRPSGT